MKILMTESQRNSMIKFHERAEKAYRQFGKTKQADLAKKEAEILKKTTK